MNRLKERALAAQTALAGWAAHEWDRMRSDERGQGSVEYVGIVIVVVAIIAVIVALASGIGETIVARLQQAVSEL